MKINHIIFVLFLFLYLSSCQRGKHKTPSSSKKAYTTLEDSDFLFNDESKLSLKRQYQLYEKKKRQLEKYQPENTEQNLRKNNDQKHSKQPKTYY